MPDFEAMQLAERGLVALGSCMVPGDSPVLSCRACGLAWGRDGDPTADEQALADLLGVRYAGPWFVLARPLTRWDEGRLDLQPADRQQFGQQDLLHFPEVVAAAADEIASRRRRSFRWCRSCRRVHPPEWFVGAERVCQDCEAAFEHFDA